MYLHTFMRPQNVLLRRIRQHIRLTQNLLLYVIRLIRILLVTICTAQPVVCPHTQALFAHLGNYTLFGAHLSNSFISFVPEFKSS